ncbi:hypothetical protein IW261DRAFT_1420325 [Armillaria novae-zelandiae]|uniref:Uncharacterized protein n=1 Tax=Armillaria novae-zelandiae TaxID=153914 RepID=A0AA39UHF2_9AGAR|nr:hypothetical protein IW261DRAFT_1420325 [Armillaria novae-zelandiae]
MGIHRASGSSSKIRLPVTVRGNRTKPLLHSRKAVERRSLAVKLAESKYLNNLTPEQLAEVESQKIRLAPSLDFADDNALDSNDWQDLEDVARLDSVLRGSEVMEISHEGSEYELARDLHERLREKWRKKKGVVVRRLASPRLKGLVPAKQGSQQTSPVMYEGNNLQLVEFDGGGRHTDVVQKAASHINKSNVTLHALRTATKTVELNVLQTSGKPDILTKGHAAHPNATAATLPLKVGMKRLCHWNIVATPNLANKHSRKDINGGDLRKGAPAKPPPGKLSSENSQENPSAAAKRIRLDSDTVGGNPDDNFHFVATPLGGEDYPYNKKAKSGTPPLSPVTSSTPFTDAAFPKIHISFRKLVEDLSSGQKTVLRNKHQSFIAVIPFGAGPKFYQSYLTLKQDTKAFLDGLKVDKGNYKISIPKSNWNGKKTRDYQTPWLFFIENVAPPLREYLLWQQTFPIDEKLVLSFIPVNPMCQTKRIVEMVNTIRTGQGFSGHAIAACEEMTHTWRLDYIPTLQNDREVGVWQLTGRPITDDDIQHRNLVNAIRSLTIMVGVDELKADGKARLECVWCKSEMHQSHACSFPDVTVSWRGPTRDDMNAKVTSGSTDEGYERGNPQTGYRHAGRGGRRGDFMTRGGFQVVRGRGRK